MNEERFEQIIGTIRDKRLMVVGDVMLDRYIWGEVERISPEAPVPVVTLTGESANLGGAANVAANIASLGAQVVLLGVVGDDPFGAQVRELVNKAHFLDGGIVVDASRPTTVKTRVIAHSQHVVRIDREKTEPLSSEVEHQLLERFHSHLSHIHGVVLQDYNKGVLTPKVIGEIIRACKKQEIPVGVDPKRENFWTYTGVTLFKPNLKELEEALGRRCKTQEEIITGGKEARNRLEANYILITLGEKGMVLIGEEEVEFIPTRAFKVHDVSGAGDTVIATMMTALVGGANVKEAAQLANWAASVVVAELGAVPVELHELRRVVLSAK